MEPKAIRYFHYKADAQSAIDSTVSLSGSKVVKLPSGKWAISRLNGVGNMRIKEFFRIDGKIN